ncbi:MAG: sporulation membrane protein YtaF [Bacillota bacterium]|nr:sporulation membrane protein YtaF [Bacillota bacterium]
MTWLIILAFATSSSIDNLGVGISYGVRNIKIRVSANLIISIICFLMSEVGINFGVWISRVFPGVFPFLIGALLLIIIGIRIILLAIPRKNKSSQLLVEQEGPNQRIEDIFRNPEVADIDQSGIISMGEAVILGVALSINALTNGLGAGLIGFSPFTISFTAAIGSFICVWSGIKLGNKLAKVRIGSFTLGQFGTIISGVIIVLIAIKLFFSF